MFKNTGTLGFVSLVSLIIAAIAGLLWINFRFTALAFGGDDFFVNWYGTRALIVDGTSPYSDSVSSEIHDLIPNAPPLINAEDSVLSTPLYAILLILPFAMVEDFNIARALWTTSQQIALVFLILLMLRITKWKPKLDEFLILSVSIFLGYFSFTVFISGNMIIWTSILLCFGLWALSVKRDEIAGATIALTTFQPQVYLFTIIFILIWSFANKRRLFLAWFFGIIFILIIIGIMFIPGWPVQYLRILSNFMEYFPYISPRRMMAEQWPGIGVQLSWAITIIITMILAIEWWLARSKDFRWFFWTVCLTIVLTRLIGIPVHSQHNLILLIPLILVFSVVQERWQKSGRWLIILLILTIFSVGWILVLNILFAKPDSSQIGLIYPLPIFLLITLYWVRWWAIRPFRLYIQEMLSRG